jgi:hypothetical protein
MTLREVVYAVGLFTIFVGAGFVVGFLFQKLMDFWWRKIQRAHDLVVLSRTLKKLNKDGKLWMVNP